MQIRSLTLSNFRNIKEAELVPCAGINLIYGQNAQGKTNLLEAIWLFTGCKSFRSKRDKEMVQFSESFSKNEVVFTAYDREQSACLWIDKKRTAMKNGVQLKSPAELIGSFYAVIFVPAHLSLVKDGPAFRRHFLDTALCEIRPKYAKALARYHRILVQRNTLLKDIMQHPELLDTLDIWDDRLAQMGAYIIAQRVAYADSLSEKAQSIYRGLSGNTEKLRISYENNAQAYSNDPYLVKEQLLSLLQRNRRSDLENRITTVGPHRDDLKIEIDGLSARNYGSQGQQRSVALSLKLAEAEMIEQETGEEPIILLDDVLSELDVTRQDYILNHIKKRQVFLTCCDPFNVQRQCSGKCFFVENGKVRET